MPNASITGLPLSGYVIHPYIEEEVFKTLPGRIASVKELKVEVGRVTVDLIPSKNNHNRVIAHTRLIKTKDRTKTVLDKTSQVIVDTLDEILLLRGYDVDIRAFTECYGRGPVGFAKKDANYSHNNP